MKESYKDSGVDIDAAQRAVELIKEHAHSTLRPEVLGDVGFFGGLFQLKGYRQPVLVSSSDGVGTKLKIASLLDRYESLGIDLVNHCVNDILTCGAVPLFFLDYVAMGKLVPDKVVHLVKGMAQACKEVGCALIGGETAEMPGVYAGSDFDVVGFIVGAVEREQLIDGSSIEEGDILWGLPSSGLHTNGYSLVRKIFGIENDRSPLDMTYPELGRSLGEELLEPHRCYYQVLKPVLPIIKGLAHITGGGLVDNIPRVVPKGLAAEIDKSSWAVPPIFSLIQERGKVSEREMYRVFNMGIGMAVIASPAQEQALMGQLPGLRSIGRIVRQRGEERVILKG
ncbi:MAG: phosphoribosylformylglycinamidine cyclo-ligase [Dehalococcoidia bacterium]